MKTRVRFAPSPTGDLHLGGLRTALFNYLWAKNQKGSFVLRIEDTDQLRFQEDSEKDLVSMLEWAGLSPDESPQKGGAYGPYRQSERLHHYREAVEKLLAQGQAYKCYSTPEELETMRKEQKAQGRPPRYDGRHRNLSQEQQKRFEAEGRKAVVRLRVPEEKRLVVRDVVRGAVSFETDQLDDQVLLKADGFPTYHLAVVVDDSLMRISHVLRAEEWLPSTPKHLLLQNFLGIPHPTYAHLPLLLNPDKSKMSKRKGDTRVSSFKKLGYLPEGLLNFLSLLGWNPGDGEEFFQLPSLEKAFSLKRIARSGAIFEQHKLDWLNQQHIQKLAQEELYQRAKPHLPSGLLEEEKLSSILELIQPALLRLSDVEKEAKVFLREEGKEPSQGVKEKLSKPETQKVLKGFLQELEKEKEQTPKGFLRAVKQTQKNTGIKGGALWGGLRWGITLEEQGPDLSKVAEIFGWEKTQKRLEYALSIGEKTSNK